MAKNCLELETIGKEMSCGWIDHAGILVRDEKRLKWVWDRFYAHSLHPPELPEIDFEKRMWVCVFRGQYSTWGYPTEIQRIAEASDSHSTFLQVHVLEFYPRPRAYLKQEFSQPFHIVEIDRSERPVHFTYKKRWSRR